MPARTLIVVALALALLGAAPAAAAPAGADAITVTRSEQLDARLVEYGFKTPALAAETNVRILLPDGYAQHPEQRYPVLYLLHGCCDFDVDGSQAWTTHGEAEKLTAGLGLIVVMPASGKGGFYSDWYNDGAFGPPMYETYHVGQLIPWVDRTFRTIADRTGRAVAGLSMGGFGTMSYAARHPDLFVAAASFSGAVNPTDPAAHAESGLSALDNGSPTAVWGPYRAVENEYAVYGWHVKLDRPVLEFSELSGADATGFTLSGSGDATVATPPFYAPNAPATVTVAGKPADVRTDANGQLTIPVSLGPSNLVQADRGVPTTVSTAQVAITAPRATVAPQCTGRVVTIWIPRRVRHARVTAAGKRVKIVRRRAAIDLRTATTPVRVVVTGRRGKHKAYRRTVLLRPCG